MIVVEPNQTGLPFREISTHLLRGPGRQEEERRAHVRIPATFLVRCWTQSELKDLYTSELSEGGMFIPTADPLPRGTVLSLKIFPLHQKGSLEIQGEVVWTNRRGDLASQGMGIKLAGVSGTRQPVLFEMLEACLRERLLERRHILRIGVRLPVLLTDAAGPLTLTTDDLSTHGLSVWADRPLQAGQMFDVELRLPGNPDLLRARSRVIRPVEHASASHPCQAGLDFTVIDQQVRQAIVDFMKKRFGGLAGGGDPRLEKRQAARIQGRIPVRVHSTGQAGTTFCRDFSLSGLFVQLFQSPKVGSFLKLDLEHPVSRRALSVYGLVVRVVRPRPSSPHRVPGAGLAFVDLSDEDQEGLYDILTGNLLV